MTSSSVPHTATTFGAVPNKLWLVDIADDGSVAWRKQDLKKPVWDNAGENIVREVPMAVFNGDFGVHEYQEGNREKLKGELKEALMQDGMFADEAEALLNTWDASYFKASGLRVFFMVPQEWTDRILPLEIKATLPVAEVKRAMVARIELITPEQREMAAKIVAVGNKFYNADIQKIYMKLGRFRNVILMDVREKLAAIINHY